MPPLFFNTSSGELIQSSHSEMAPPWKPLAALIVADVFNYRYEDFREKRVKRWEDDRVQEIGRLVAKDLAEADPPQALTSDMISRLYNLGLMPNNSYFHKRNGRYSGVTDFREKIEIDDIITVNTSQRNKNYQEMEIDEVVHHILSAYNELTTRKNNKTFDGPITTEIILSLNRMGLAPGLKFIGKKYGGLRALNEHIGFPNIREWDDNDYISYGVSVISYNGEKSLTVPNIRLLSSLSLGPDYDTIHERFGWKNYVELIRNEYALQKEKELKHKKLVMDYYQNNASVTEVPYEVQARYRALRILTDHYRMNGIIIPNQPTQQSVKSVVKRISKQQSISIADIEITTVILNISDDLWHTDPGIKPPILPRR